MAYQLPNRFANDTNEVVELLRNYEAQVDPREKDDLLRRALVASCDLLNSIDLVELERELNTIYVNARVYQATNIKTQSWSEAMFDDPSHFDYFLDNVEDRLMQAACIREVNRDRILRELRKLRQITREQARSVSPNRITTSIRRLRDDVCILKDQQIAKDNRKTRAAKVIKTMLVSVIVINAAGTVLFDPASPAALAASVTIGGVGQFIPDHLLGV